MFSSQVDNLQSMSSRPWTLLYKLQRMHNAAEHAVSYFASSASATIPAAFRAGVTALKTKDLTSTICMTGSAMLPTLNSVRGDGDSVDRLLMRSIPKVYGRGLFPGDVVAFHPPDNTEGEPVVRRVAAIEGEEMVSDDPADEAFRLPEGHYWVLADNEEIPSKEAQDSRTFGPLHINSILGRIIYYVRSHTEHGPVENSKFVNRADKAILEAELDVEEMLATKC